MSYTLIQQFNPQHAHLRFDGQFQGNPVTWDTHLYTVAEYNRQHNSANGVTRQFIEIKEGAASMMNLKVVLNVGEINPPTIQKMMIMIRQYKKLSAGRHEYGDKILLNQQRKS